MRKAIFATFGVAAFLVANASAAGLNQQWVKTQAGTSTAANKLDVWQAVTVDASGNSYVTGFTRNGATPDVDLHTAKYDANGNQIWRTVYVGVTGMTEQGIGIRVNSTGDVYVAATVQKTFATTTVPAQVDLAAIKYNGTTGVQQWASFYNPNNNNSGFWWYQQCCDIDANGNFYVAGFVGKTTQAIVSGALNGANDAVIWQVKPNGSTGWVYTTFGDFIAATNNNNNFAAIKVVGNTVYGTAIVCKENASVTNYDIRTVRLDNDNNVPEWVSDFGYAELVTEQPMCLDANANHVWVGGNGIQTNRTPLAVHYNASNGTLVSSYQDPLVGYISTSGNYYQHIYANADGSAFAAGRHFITSSNLDWLVMKINANGTSGWRTTFGNALLSEDQPQAGVGLDKDGNFLVCGHSVTALSGTTITGQEQLVKAFNPTTGAVQYTKSHAGMGLGGSLQTRAFDIEVSPNGNVWVAGRADAALNTLATDFDASLVKYAPPLIVAAGYQVNYGVETTAPGVANLQANDGDTVQLCLNPDQEDPNPVQMEVSATNGNVNPATLNFNLVCRAEANDREVYVEMFSFSLGDWVGSPSFPVTDSDALYTVAAPGTAGDFVNDGDGAMITRLTGFLGAADSPTLPCWDFNYCYWE